MTDPAGSVLLDENVERQVLAYVRAEGLDGTHVVDSLGTGVEDATVFQVPNHDMLEGLGRTIECFEAD